MEDLGVQVEDHGALVMLECLEVHGAHKAALQEVHSGVLEVLAAMLVVLEAASSGHLAVALQLEVAQPLWAEHTVDLEHTAALAPTEVLARMWVQDPTEDPLCMRKMAEW